MSHPTKTKYYQAAMDQLVLGARYNRSGKHNKADAAFSQADAHLKDHVDYLKSIGNHEEAVHVEGSYKAQKRHMMAATRPAQDEKPGKPVKKSELTEMRQLAKGIFAKAEPTFKPQTGPSANPRYDYRGLHELHPEDQRRVLGASGNPSMYSGQEHHKFLYPVDQEGRLVHSQRIAAPAHHDFAAAKQVAEQAASSGPKFAQGMGVRMQQEGHELYGKLGIVQPPHPSYPDKIQVQFQGGRREFLEPGQIKASGLASKVQKAHATVIDIRSRLGKGKSKH